MDNSCHHIIRSQILEVEIPSRRDHHVLSEEITELYYQQLKPQLEQLLDRLAPAGVIYNLDQLQLDLGTLDPRKLDQVFSSRFLEAMEREIQKIKPEISDVLEKSITADRNWAKKEQLSEKEQVRRAFVFFLENGRLPWWFEVESIQALEEKVQNKFEYQL